MNDSAKHPALIPKNSTIAKLIIISVHEQVFHYGAESTLARLIQRFWIPSARPQVKRVCRDCVRCRREHGPSFTLPDPAPLPADQIKEVYPFEVTGVDYTGAIPIRQKGEDISAYLFPRKRIKVHHLRSDRTSARSSSSYARRTARQPSGCQLGESAATH
jgi:hypothetical protein